MKLQDDPETEQQQTVVDAVMTALNEVDPTKDLYNRDSIYFNTSDAAGTQFAILRFEKFPEIPATEFGSGKSSLQMREEFERELMETLPETISFERNTRLEFGFFES